ALGLGGALYRPRVIGIVRLVHGRGGEIRPGPLRRGPRRGHGALRWVELLGQLPLDLALRLLRLLAQDGHSLTTSLVSASLPWAAVRPRARAPACRCGPAGAPPAGACPGRKWPIRCRRGDPRARDW